jgi:hypothetical protein
MLAFKLILFTGFGMCTDDTPLLRRSMVLPPNRYSLRDGCIFRGGKVFKNNQELSKSQQKKYKKVGKKHFTLAGDDHTDDIRAYIRPIDVLENIALREKWKDRSSIESRLLSEAICDNKATLKAAEVLLQQFATCS